MSEPMGVVEVQQCDKHHQGGRLERCCYAAEVVRLRERAVLVDGMRETERKQLTAAKEDSLCRAKSAFQWYEDWKNVTDALAAERATVAELRAEVERQKRIAWENADANKIACAGWDRAKDELDGLRKSLAEEREQFKKSVYFEKECAHAAREERAEAEATVAELLAKVDCLEQDKTAISVSWSGALAVVEEFRIKNETLESELAGLRKELAEAEKHRDAARFNLSDLNAMNADYAERERSSLARAEKAEAQVERAREVLKKERDDEHNSMCNGVEHSAPCLRLMYAISQLPALASLASTGEPAPEVAGECRTCGILVMTRKEGFSHSAKTGHWVEFKKAAPPAPDKTTEER